MNKSGFIYCVCFSFGENLSEERLFPIPLSKDFYIVFWRGVIILLKYIKFTIYRCL